MTETKDDAKRGKGPRQTGRHISFWVAINPIKTMLGDAPGGVHEEHVVSRKILRLRHAKELKSSKAN